MAPDLLIACVTIVVLAAIFAVLAAFRARVCEWRIVGPAKQSRTRKPPEGTEPADVTDPAIVPGMDGKPTIREVAS